MTVIIGIVVLLGGLIFFHEMGHYLVAKAFGVRVEVFSLGFGKKLFKKTIGETEYCLSIFPLGGYVKLMGDDPYKPVPAEEAHRAFASQKLYKRFLIVAAGPIANLLLAIVLFMVVFFCGQPQIGTRVGSVLAESPAWEAGIRPGDRITEIMNTKLHTWNQIDSLLRPLNEIVTEVQLEREGTQLVLPVKLSKIEAKNEYGEDVLVGGIDGISPMPLAPVLGISDPNSMAFKAGLRTGDLLTKINSRTIQAYEEIDAVLREMWKSNEPLTLSVKRSETPDGDLQKGSEKSFTLVLPEQPGTSALSPFGLNEVLGIFPSELFVRSISADSPAEKGGLKVNDRIVRVGDKTVYNFDRIVDIVQVNGRSGSAVSLQIEREGTPVTLNLVPVETEQEDPLTRMKIKKFLIGFVSQKAYAEPEMVEVQIRNPIELVTKSVSETFDLSERMMISLGKLVVGKISVKNLGGPVLIASVAGKSLDAGIIPFLQMMALISINLFLLNLFPIPILDGGHLLFFIIEGIKGKPVSIRTMEIANQMGMVFILLLVGLTLFNDISRMVAH